MGTYIKDIRKYLDRIHLAMPEQADKQFLDEIIYAHQCVIPFENLDTFLYKKLVSADPDAVFEKIVEGGRGGYCYEMNNLFYHAIKELGYDADPCLVKVPGDGGFEKHLVFPGHRSTVVTLDGKRWFCDVGFGGPIPGHAMLLEIGLEQEICGDRFRFLDEGDAWLALQRLSNGEFRTLYWVNPTPATEAEFIPGNYYTCAPESPNSHFRDALIINRRTPDGHVSIDGWKFIRQTKAHGREETTIEDREMLAQILKDEFSLEI